IAGAWYLAMIASGAIGILYVPSRIVSDGPAAIVDNLVAHEQLVRFGILTSIGCQVCFLFLGQALRRLFAGTHDELTRSMVTLIVAAAPIAIVNELFNVAALELAHNPAHHDLALTFFVLRQAGVGIAGFFWGLWLFPFGLLVMRSGFIPKILGVLLLAGGLAYVIDSSLALFAPVERAEVSAMLMLPLAIGELAMVTWLFVKGARRVEVVPELQRR
ncbi:MAG: DUF4386 domain-containing protein, partial [Kofleriaceae bacterium]